MKDKDPGYSDLQSEIDILVYRLDALEGKIKEMDTEIDMLVDNVFVTPSESLDS